MQHQKLPPEVLEALDTEAWFRERLSETGRRGLASRATPAPKPSKEALYDEAIAWFLKEPVTESATDWPHPGRQWPKVTFWVSDSLLEQCERRAHVHRVARSKVLALALMRYCEQRVPKELVAFRREAFEGARDLYRRLKAPAERRRRTPSRR